MLFLSIVVPTYNRAHIIGKTMLSLLDQSVGNYEIIVVDDGSTDDTENVIKALNSDKVRYVKTENGERARARNIGTRLAKGNYVNWFDSDDLALHNHCETILNTIRDFDSPEIIRLDYMIYNETKNKKKKVCHKKNVRNDIIKGNSFGTASVVVKRHIALMNPFNEDIELSASEDYELWLRLLSKYKVTPVPVVTSWLVQHDERSVAMMSNSAILEKRFGHLISYSLSNPETAHFIGRSKNYFLMRNFLVLSADLAVHKHRKKALLYLGKALTISPLAIFQRIFYASIKHIFNLKFS